MKTEREEFYKEAFENYIVPENIKKISMELCNRFVILGVCDPMYICNVIAKESKIGDGEGNFTNDIIDNSYFKKIAERLQGSYGCNILENEIPEIEFCLKHGYINNEKAIEGLNLFQRKINNELTTCDEWRIDYLERLLEETKESLKSYL